MIEAFLQRLRAGKNLSDHTLAAYRADLRPLLDEAAAAGRDVLALSPDDLSDHLWRRRKDLKPATLRRLAQSIRRFYRFLVDEGHLERDPARDLPVPKPLPATPRLVGPLERDRLLAVPPSGKPLQVRLKAMLEILSAAGLRVEELLRLETTDADPHGSWVRSRDARVLLPDRAAAALRNHFESLRRTEKDGGKYLFPNPRGLPLTRVAFWYQVKKQARSAGIASPPSPRDLRRAPPAIEV